MSDIQVIGVKDVIKELRSVDPELRKQFNKDAKNVAKPIVDKAKAAYPAQYLSGMVRPWRDRRTRRILFPYDQAEARKGVVFKIDTRGRAVGVITVIQKNPAAAIVDMAGKKGGDGPQGARYINALTMFHGRPSRVMWPAADASQGQVEDAMIELINKAANEVSYRITVIK